MASRTSKTVTLTKLIPSGLPSKEHFTIVEEDASNLVASDDGDLILQVICMSADPYLRSGCKTGEVPRPMSGFVVGKVIESKNCAWPVDSLMGAALPFTSIQKLNDIVLKKTITWNLTDYVTEENATLGLGVLGMPGATAYGGLIDVLRPDKKKNETLFVSSAAGAVGSMVGQLAKNVFNCTVIGSCGGETKTTLITEKFGFDHSIDYKTVSTSADLAAKIKECSDGIDMYFENVGGMHFEAAMSTLRPHGRIAVCGCISRYNDASGTAPLNTIDISQMIYTFQRVEGFVCMPYLSGAKMNFLKDMSEWHKEMKVGCEQCFYDGIEEWPTAFQALFTGANVGKVCVRLL